MDRVCPDCGAPLEVAQAAGARTLVCRSCGGRLFGLSPFEKMLTDGAGSRVWVASATGEQGGACPYCSAPMHRPAGGEVPAGLAVCRTCQEVWVPAGGADWLTAHAGTGGGPDPLSPLLPAECTNCGAPYQPDEEGRCHWCHAQIAAPQPVVVFMQPDTV